MRQHFGIGLTLHGHARGFKLGAQLSEVFDDAVLHDGELAVLADAGVLLAGRSHYARQNNTVVVNNLSVRACTQ